MEDDSVVFSQTFLKSLELFGSFLVQAKNEQILCQEKMKKEITLKEPQSIACDTQKK